MDDRSFGVHEDDDGVIMATLSMSELSELIEDSEFLKALLLKGVTEWEGFENALQYFKDKIDEPPVFFN